MPKKKQKQEAGVPEWVVTYGDMMSLLLCFFILLAAFSELKQEREYQRVITAVKEAFGYSGGVGVLPSDDPPLRSMLQLMETLMQQNAPQFKNLSESQDRGMEGKQTKVSRVQEGMMFTIGGSLTFEPGSAVLKPEAKEELLKVAKMLQGRRNKIEVRGHASSKILPADSPYADLLDLSYARAKTVAAFLHGEGGLLEDVLAVEARGDREPIQGGRYTDAGQIENRRVEVIMTEVMIDELNKNASHTAEDSAGR